MTDISKRPKREMSLQERSDLCKGLSIASSITDTVANVADSCAAIQSIAPPAAAIGVVSHVFTGGINIAMTALDCSSVPFDEIKEILKTEFNEINRKLDKNTETLKEIHEKVSQTLHAVESLRLEMKEQFKEVLESIRTSRIAPLIDQINIFIDSFDKEKKVLSILKKDQYVSKLEEEGYLNNFRGTKTPVSDSLSENLNLIISGNLAIPENGKDDLALSALRALYYGTGAYLEVMYFLVEKYTYLADFYYQKRNFVKYNSYFDSVLNNFHTFKIYLVGTGDNVGLIPKVVNEIKKVMVHPLTDKSVKNELNNQVQNLLRLQDDTNNMILSVIDERPETVKRIEFNLNIPVHGNWKDGKNVRYSVQYEKENTYSKISEWSNIFPLYDKANPTLDSLPPAERGTQRLIFRQIDDQVPELVGVINSNKKQFTDINRDLYDAAGNVHSEIAMADMEQLLLNGADINEVFDDGRLAIHKAAESNNEKLALKFMIDTHKTDINVKDQMGYAPIHIAIESRSVEFFKMLLKHGADVNIETDLGYTPLHLAAKFTLRKFVKKLIQKEGINISKKDKNGLTPLHFAVVRSARITEMLVTKLTELEVNEKSNLHLTPFHLAIMMDINPYNNKKLSVLLNSGKVNINEGNDENMTALHFACLGNKSLLKVQYLLDIAGIDANLQTTNNKWTPLHFALFLRKYDIVLELLDFKDINFSLTDGKGVTPLTAAVASGSKEVVEKLLTKGADVNTVTDEGFTLLHTAALRRDNIIDSLPLAQLDINAKSLNGTTPLCLAISRNNTEPAIFLLENKANVEDKTREGYAPLHLSVIEENVEILKALLEQKADINVKTNTGMTPLHLAASKGNLSVVQCLIENHADVNIVDNDKYIYFYHAVQNGHMSIVKYLIDSKIINIDDVDNNEHSLERFPSGKIKPIKYWSVCIANKYGQLELVKYFVGTLKIVACNPVYTAAYYGHFDIVKYLVEEATLDVNSVYDDNLHINVALMGAIKGVHLNIVKYLVVKGANVNHSIHLFEYALESKNLEIVAYLVDNGVNLKATYMDGNTYAYAAAAYCLDCLKYLEQRKLIDVNYQFPNGNTLLHDFASFGNPEVVYYLCSIKADITIKNNNQETAYDIAKKAGNKDKYSCLNPHPSERSKRSIFLLEKNNNEEKWLSTEKVKGNQKKNQLQWMRNLSGNLANAYKDISKFPRSLSPKGPKDSMASEGNLSQNINMNGILLLMDIILRSANGQKYKFTDHGSSAEFDAPALALNITERFEKILNTLNNAPAEEQIDLSEVYSGVSKAIRGNKANEIPDILKLHLKSQYSLNDDEVSKLLSGVVINY